MLSLSLSVMLFGRSGPQSGQFGFSQFVELLEWMLKFASEGYAGMGLQEGLQCLHFGF